MAINSRVTDSPRILKPHGVDRLVCVGDLLALALRGCIGRGYIYHCACVMVVPICYLVLFQNQKYIVAQVAYIFGTYYIKVGLMVIFALTSTGKYWLALVYRPLLYFRNH